MYKLHVKVVAWRKIIVLLHVRRRNAYQYVSDFDKSRFLAYWSFNLSYHSIATPIGRDPMTIYRIFNRWVQESQTDQREESQRSIVTNSSEGRLLTDMVLMERMLSQLLSQEMRSYRLIRQRTPLTTTNELRYLVKALCAAVTDCTCYLIFTIQCSVVIFAGVRCSRQGFHVIYLSKFLSKLIKCFFLHSIFVQSISLCYFHFFLTVQH